MTNTTTVRERPILFSAPMVRALLDGRKTQTRRVVKLPGWSLSGCDLELDAGGAPCIIAATSRCLAEIPCPFGAPGDRLWVREAWWHFTHFERKPDRVEYAADRGISVLPLGGWEARKRPSIHMPRWACRLVLELTDVRVERLQAMATRDEAGDESDALAEGIVCEPDGIGPRYGLPGAMTNRTAYAAFARLWDSLNAERGFGWTANPWVWVLGFRRIAP